MMKQTTLLDVLLQQKSRTTRRETFLNAMDQVVPWSELVELIQPVYPASGRGRPPIGIERMLRLYFIQQWYGFSDEGTEDALYDMPLLSRFAGIDLTHERVPDATTLLNFRHLLEEHKLAPVMLGCINALLEAKGLLMREGTIVDATLIAAPPSTKNKSGERDPEIHQTKKGNQWYFGMKAHIGVDAESGLVHTVVGTSAHVSDVVMTSELLHGREQVVIADAGYIGVEKREENTGKTVEWLIAMKRGKLKAMPEGRWKETVREIEKKKAQIRSRVEHPFHVIKNLFHYRKTRYRGLEKNTHQLQILFGLCNLYRSQKRLMGSI